jgi:hypothetical protein
MALASGTSLLLIAVNALVAFAAQGHWPASGLPLMLPLLGGGTIGAVLGQRLAPQLSDRRLRQGFSLLLIGSAALTGVEAWRRHQHPPTPAYADAVTVIQEKMNVCPVFRNLPAAVQTSIGLQRLT